MTEFWLTFLAYIAAYCGLACIGAGVVLLIIAGTLWVLA